jgi:hypothetical protein
VLEVYVVDSSISQPLHSTMDVVIYYMGATNPKEVKLPYTSLLLVHPAENPEIVCNLEV